MLPVQRGRWQSSPLPPPAYPSLLTVLLDGSVPLGQLILAEQVLVLRSDDAAGLLRCVDDVRRCACPFEHRHHRGDDVVLRDRQARRGRKLAGAVLASTLGFCGVLRHAVSIRGPALRVNHDGPSRDREPPFKTCARERA